MVDVGCGDDLVDAFRRVERLIDNLCAFGFDAYDGPHSLENLKAKKGPAHRREDGRVLSDGKTIVGRELGLFG